jgi:cyanate permease
MVNSDSIIKQGGANFIEPYKTKYRWVMLALASILYFCFSAVLSSIAPLITPIIADLNISFSQMGVILGAWPLTYIVMSLVGGTIIDRWGIRKSLFLGILIISLSAGLRYFANGFTLMFICVALFGVGGPMISIGAPKTIATWFRGKERAIAIGVYMAGTALGSLLSLSITNSVIMPLTGYSWRLTFVFYSLLAFAAALAWLFFAKDTKIEEDKVTNSITTVFKSIIKVRNVQLILLIAFLSMVISHGLTNWLPKILETGGLTPKLAGFAASIPVLAGIPAVLSVPRLTPESFRSRVAAIVSLLGAIVLFVIANTSGFTLITGLVFYGLLYRCAMPLLMLILMDLPEIGPRNMGAAAGLYFCIGEIGGFAGPSLMGIIVDLTGDFFGGMITISVISLIIGVMAFMIKTPPNIATLKKRD